MKAFIFTFFALIACSAAAIWCIGAPTLASGVTLLTSLSLFFAGVANIPLDL
jgi:hypothetical protein